MAGVRLVVNLHAKPGQATAYAAAWAPRAEEVRSTEPGCLQYELFQSASHPDNLTVLEWWEDRAAFEAHWALERERTPLGVEFLGHPRDREVGRDGLEIYWEQQTYRFDRAEDAWLPR